MSDLTREQVEAMLEAANRATAGPWYVGEDYYGGISIRTVPEPADNIDGANTIFENTGRGSGNISPEDAAFIALARTAMPALAKSWLEQDAKLKEAPTRSERSRRSHSGAQRETGGPP